MIDQQQSLVVVGGGPGGYEAALVAAALGAQVTLVDRDGLGGAAVLTDCVPSKALISTAEYVAGVGDAEKMGVRYPMDEVADKDTITMVPSSCDPSFMRADILAVNERIVGLARAQSRDIGHRLAQVGVRVVVGSARLAGPTTVIVSSDEGEERIGPDMILLATGSTPRVLPTAVPDGERILTWKDVWSLRERPERLVVVGSGVTGAEFAQAYLGLGCDVTLVSSRDQVLPGHDHDAAQVIEEVFRTRGMHVLSRCRATEVTRHGDEVVVVLDDGSQVVGSHVVMAVGSVPATADIGLQEAGVALQAGGHIEVDRVSRTTVRGIYAAGDCTGVLPLASVAAQQGRIAVAHAMGDAVAPLQTVGVSSNIFTSPEIATVGITDDQAQQMPDVQRVTMPLATNPRAKMHNVTDGFVKLFSRSTTNVLLGGVVVAPRASELIFPIALAVQHRMTAEQMAATTTVYPSLSGTIAEAARRLHSV